MSLQSAGPSSSYTDAMKNIVALLAFSAFSAAAAAADPHSFSEPDKFLVRHVALDLAADFDARRLQGTAELTVEQVDPNADALVLDSSGLEVRAVHLIEASGHAKVLAFKLGAPDPILGSKLTIEFQHCCAATPEMRIRIDYRTSNEASALQWLEPAQTSGPHPFMYTQGQAILARSWIPIQDSPGIRVTYSARIRTPPELVAVMSGARVKDPAAAPGEFRFEMKQPIPAYLIALAIGDLKFQALGDRVGVWAEPSRLAAAAYELADLQRMLEAGEQMAGPYRWERYDVLIMPRAFAYGGMENPRISFVSPSIIAGDRSLVSTVVHELAHSWSGNLVTNATWNDFWLNEGFTSYLERRLVEALYGARRADMEDAIAYEGLVQTIEDLKAEGHEQDTDLKLDLAGRDPNEGTSDVAYDKGARFLSFLEGRFGRPAFRRFPARVLRHACLPGHDDGGLPHSAPRTAREAGRSGDHGRGDRCLDLRTGPACDADASAAGRVRGGRSGGRRLARGHARDGRPAGQGLGAAGMDALPRRTARRHYG